VESLFSTNISINNKTVVYQVYFNEEKYIFLPGEKENGFPSFSFKREHDEWHNQEDITAQLKLQATNALETYLLAQH
jgi:hypothetical protein